MRRRHLGFLLIGLFGLTFITPAPAKERVSGIDQWNFDVYLNDRKIGKHSFKVSESAGIRQVQSEAKFKYTILLIPAYRYEHRAAERQCVMTFAYWNPNFLKQSRLLNPQTGEFVDVIVEQLGNEMLEVRGQTVDATRFKLTANEIDLTLWYSQDDEWLALESVAKGGHIIRYELS